jgi:FdhD protein
MAEGTSRLGVVKWHTGVTSVVPADDVVAVEAPLELRFGPKASTILMRTPGQDSDEELARGFLFTEGMIGAGEDVLSISRPPGLHGDEEGNVLAVELRAGAGVELERLFYSSSSCGVCGKNRIAQLAVRGARPTHALRVPAITLAGLPGRLRASQPLFAATGGLHAAALFNEEGELIALREDVGRHNALDKLVGFALGAGRLPLAGHGVLVSGRTSYEILQKSIAAGVELVAAVGAPSSLAVRLAEEFDVTLVGFLRDGSFNIYSGASRVVC